MKMTITFKNIEHTESLDQRIQEKAKKAAKFWDGKTEMKWTCWTSNGEHFCEIVLLGPKVEYHAKAKSDDMYKTFDLVMDKIERQVEKSKSKIKNKIHRRHSGQDLLTFPPSEAWGDFEAWQEEQQIPTKRRRVS